MNRLRFFPWWTMVALLGLMACGSEDKPASNEDRRAECPAPVAPLLQIGEVCNADCDCETGLCYDEAYVAPHKICSRECEGGCGDGYKCLVFSTVHWDKYPMDLHTLCMPTCDSVDDCKAYSDIYTYCPTSMTQWELQTVTGMPTCQTEQK